MPITALGGGGGREDIVHSSLHNFDILTLTYQAFLAVYDQAGGGGGLPCQVHLRFWYAHFQVFKL